MKSGGEIPLSLKFSETYTEYRKKLCHEPEATAITPMKSECSKQLNDAMNKVWRNQHTNHDRFFMAIKYVALSVFDTCSRFARTSSSTEVAAKKTAVACATAFLQENTGWLRAQFDKFGLTELVPNLRFKMDNKEIGSFTFKSALEYLSAPICENNKSNEKSLLPRCKRHPLEPVDLD